MYKYRDSKVKDALILQGDWEGGLTYFAQDLIAAGTNVTKVLLHAGDLVYKWKGIPTVKYDAPLEQFESWLRKYISESNTDCLIVYNQYRPYNAISWKVAEELGLECIVLELGLLRPDFCSIYTRDCNQFEYLAGEWDKLVNSKESLDKPKKPPQLARMSTPCKMTQFGLYFLFSRFISTFARQYTHYCDQRTMNVRHHLRACIIGGLRFQGRKKQSCFDEIFATRWSNKYYFVPLQVHTDSQITERSNFKNIEEFIHLVVNSFKKNAPRGTKLVFKVHPMDRGYKDYHELIKKLSSNVGGHRVLYLDRIHLPTVLDHARACITINSSVGLSALIHRTPLITLGEAAFDLKELTFQGQLDDFWIDHGKVNMNRVRKYVSLLKHTSQAQGTLYQRLYAARGACKIQWPTMFKSLFEADSNTSLTTKELVSNSIGANLDVL